MQDEALRAEALRPPRIDALEEVANRPIIHHVIDVLRAAGVTEIIVASSSRVASDIRDCLAAYHEENVSLRYVEQQAPLRLGDALELAAPIMGGAPCIVHVASGLLGQSLAPFVERLRTDSPDVALIVHHGPGPDEQLSAATQEMLHIAALDPEQTPLSMAGVCLFGPGALNHARRAAWGAGGEIDLTMVDELIAGAGGSLDVVQVMEWRRYAGDPLDLLELNRIALDRLDAVRHRACNNGNRIEGRVWIHEDASVSDSVIVGPAMIGAGARIDHAYIGPYTSIGAGARIEGAEIERSIILARASILHLGFRIVASVVGHDARVFRDFSLPRALRLRVGAGTEVALS